MLISHFSYFTGERPRLKPDAVPSIFNFQPKVEEESPRCKRIRHRKELREENDTFPDITDVQSCVTVGDTSSSAVSDTCSTPYLAEPIYSTKGTQCDTSMNAILSIEIFVNNPKMVNYYTGFRDYSQFMLFFYCLGPSVNELNGQCTLLDPKEQLFMVLMKLRRAKEDIELAMFFDVSESTVSRTITTWINFMYFQLKELNIWPSKEIVDLYMPLDFSKKFPNTRVILDATEVPLQKPSEVNAQSITWSSYKHKNTLKTMVGITPRGCVSYISDSYGGSASDRQIIENSELLKPTNSMFKKGDSIMADRGIMVQDLFAAQDVQVNTPTMLKGKSQLDQEEIIHDRRVASKRIHVERVICLSKGYRILTNTLPISKLPYGSRIVYVCLAICNFRNSIVDKYA